MIGAACAQALGRRGLVVGVFDPGPPPGAASPASAGMLAAQIEAADDAWLTLAASARDRYAALATDLAATTGMDIGLRQDGIAAVAFTDERANALQNLIASQRRAGLRAEWLSGAEVERRWRGAAPGCVGALFAPDDGAVDPPALTQALVADAAQGGARFIHERVTAVSRTAGRVSGVVTDRHQTAARHVVIAAGAWSPAVIGLPRPLPVVPVRGQLAEVDWPAGVAPATLYHDHGYVLQRGDKAILGSTMEHAGFDAGVTAAGQAEILSGARRLLPSLSERGLRSWAGLRPVTPDGLPLVGPDREVDGLWYATGHGRNGILLAALTGDVIADLIATGATAVDLSLFRPDRFALGPSP